jgi:hypothetical protein
MPSWVVEEWNNHESNHLCSSYQVTWGFAISFQNKPCSTSSFDSLRSLDVYMSFLLLMMAICGAQGRIKDKAYLFHIYCEVKDWIQEENQIVQSDQDMGMMGMVRWILGLE